MALGLLICAGMRRQLPQAVAAGLLTMLALLAIATVLGVGSSARPYVASEMDRIGFGGMTLWVDASDGAAEELAGALEGDSLVHDVAVQGYIRAAYRANGNHSDDEGQVIAYDADEYAYRFLSADLASHVDAPAIEPGTVYVSPALAAGMGIAPGDAVSFEISRDGTTADFAVVGFFEDPYLGSSMVDMKSFLVSASDYDRLADEVAGVSEFNELAKPAARLHVAGDGAAREDGAELSRAVGNVVAAGGFSRAVEFSYTADAMAGYMVLQLTILAGVLAAFSVVMLAVVLVVTGHGISADIDRRRHDLGVLKVLGLTASRLRLAIAIPYGAAVALGAIVGMSLAFPLTQALLALTVSSTGLLVQASQPIGALLLSLLAVIALLAAFIAFKTRAVSSVAPIEAVERKGGDMGAAARISTPVDSKALSASLALRHVVSRASDYAAVLVIAVLLSFFAATVARMNVWLGPNGEGLMDAFSVAAHDIGVQPLHGVDMQEVEAAISDLAPIEERYELAMVNGSVNGAELTVNAIDEPRFLHILSGRHPQGEDELVLTEMVANMIGASIGDEVTVTVGAESAPFAVTGIYQCANETGNNVGMTREGLERLGAGGGFIWCHHYILSHHDRNDEIATTLQKRIGVDAAIHTNTWSGLDGVVATLHAVTAGVFALCLVFVVVVVALVGARLLRVEERDLATCLVLGFAPARLRRSFALRFAIVMAVGALAGVAVAAFAADPIVGMLLKSFGVGEFSARLALSDTLVPVAVIAATAFAFAYACSRRIRSIDPAVLLARTE